MILPEVSRCFPVSIEELRIYEENGMLRRKENEDGEMDYSEEDLQQIRQFHFLQKAGMELDSLKQLARLLEKETDTRDEQIRLLRKLRFELVEEIHDRQQDLDRLDYFIHEIKTQRKEMKRT